MLYVEAYSKRNTIPNDALIIDTTSRSLNWSKGLSPFVLYAGHLYRNYYAENVENAWQAAKVYPEFVDENQNPTSEYFEWANKIWKSKYAFRYPMGRDKKPLYSYWDGVKLSYVDARINIYIPIYSASVIKSEAYKKLLDIYNTETRDIYLIDFDGYNHVKIRKTLDDVIKDADKKMGHAFVLYGLLIQHDKRRLF